MIKTVALEKIFRTEEVETLALNKVSIEVKEGGIRSHYGPFRLWKINVVEYLRIARQPDQRRILPERDRSIPIYEASGRNCAKGLSGSSSKVSI